MSAQVFDMLHSLRVSEGSSATEPVPLHPSLREIFASFNLPLRITIRQLYDLLSMLDRECLRHSTDIALDPAQNLTLEVESVAELPSFLSDSLTRCGYPGTSKFQEVQLRALIASLALLRHHGVHTLNPDLHDKLKLENLPARFENLAFHVTPSSTLADRIRHAPNVYLIQLASLYVSFINRGESRWPSIVEPSVTIFFSALALGGGQYNHIKEIIQSLNQIVSIWQRPQRKYQALCSLQEYTRLATSLCRESAITDEFGEIRTATAAIVTVLIDKANEILSAEIGKYPAELARRWHKPIAILRRTPDLGQGYYIYGLLDCVSQLAAVSVAQMLEEGLRNRIRNFIFESAEPEFRWKAIEIILSCPCSRKEQYQMLDRDIEERVTNETKANIREEMRFIQMHMETDEKEGLKLSVLQPLTRVFPIIPSDPGENSVEKTVASKPESDLTRSLTKNSTTYSLRSSRKFTNSYHSAGLFNHCEYAFFNNDSKISIYKLGDLRGKPTSPTFSEVFTQQYKHGESIRTVTSCRSSIILVSNKRLLIFNIIEPATPIDTTSHGNWDPSGLACHESEALLVVFSGQCQRNGSNKYNGQIRVHRYSKDGPTEKLPVSVLKIPADDCPKRLSFHAESRILTCITRLHNKILLWKLGDNFSSSSEPFEFSKNKYTAETGETGVTSATIYRSPSQQLYVLCTTAPSTERYRHDGEWSFILLIPPDVVRSPLPPGSKIHAFKQLESHRPLFMGCSSIQHHIFAVLENSGRLSVLRLKKHCDGGIHSEEDAEILAHSLCKQDRPLPDCLRFDPTGSYLFAVDPKGKLVVTEFELGRPTQY